MKNFSGIEILIVYSIIASSITAIKGAISDSWLWFWILLALIFIRFLTKHED